MTAANTPQPPLGFDPRLVPVLGVDDQLPKVSAQALQVSSLVQRFASQHIWTPELLDEPRFSQRAPVHASVLVPLVMRDSGLTVLLTERTANLSSHSGQVAFPGGKADPEDRDAIETALREAQEEVGLEAQHIEVMGALPTYTTGSAYIVTPVVALVHPGFSLTPNPGEVDDVFDLIMVLRKEVDGKLPKWMVLEDDVLMTAWDYNVEEGFWFITMAANYDNHPIDTVLVANFTNENYLPQIQDLTAKISSGRMP